MVTLFAGCSYLSDVLEIDFTLFPQPEKMRLEYSIGIPLGRVASIYIYSHSVVECPTILTKN